MFTLKAGRVPPADVKNIIFFVRPKLELMDIIAENVMRLVSLALSLSFSVILICTHVVFMLILSIQRGQVSATSGLPHPVRTSAQSAVRAASEGARRPQLLHQHRWVHSGPHPLRRRPALHGVRKCVQGKKKGSPRQELCVTFRVSNFSQHYS